MQPVPGLHQLEFFLLRYAGDATKGESINLGIVAIAPEHGQAGGFADVRFTRNWRRLQCFDPLVDTEELAAFEREIRRDLQDPRKRAELLRRTGDSWSNVIQYEPLQGFLGDSPAKELEKLCSLYLETPAGLEIRELSGRQRILAVMNDELNKAGVLPLMSREFPVAEYTPDNPLKFDFGYPSRESLKFLQAISLAHGVTSGVIWARRFPQIAAGIKQKRGVTAWLTAVVDDELPKRDEVSCVLDFMQESGIAIAREAEVPDIAERIRIELRV
jgi:hypothetical protein